MLEVGTRVMIHKPDDVTETPAWVPDMDELDGCTAIVRESEDEAHIRVDITGYVFNENWLEVFDDKFDKFEPSFDHLKMLFE